MISLRFLRLVGWHFFDDVVIPIGEATLFAGDNGSGKSTIIDGIQYALAANLAKIRFNAAAADKKASRTLEGYVRGKTGLESGEYLRDDAVGHVMLQFSKGREFFSAGICVEAFKDEVQIREYPWIADGIPVQNIPVEDETGAPLLGRPFRERIKNMGALVFESKREYTSELTHRLGVFRRNAEFNPYLDALIRSVGFTPLTSVDRFVCDYILEERPVDVSAMKSNLESYKEAEAEANETIRKIEALQRIVDTSAEWQQLKRLLLLQEYLKVRLEAELADKKLRATKERIEDLEEELERRKIGVEGKRQERRDLEAARRDTETALARNDAYLLVRSLRERREAILRDLERARQRLDRWNLLTDQVAALLEKPWGKGKRKDLDLDEELSRLDQERASLADSRSDNERERRDVAGALSELSGELVDLERGLARYPASSMRLKEELTKKNIQAWIFADLVEVADADWQNALEGWLNTLRFAVLVEPESFSDALRVYDALPREVAGVALPNLRKMGSATVKRGALSELIITESPFARQYADFVLGDVIRATLDTLKDYDKAVTRDCMTYSRHTASRIKEEVYSRWYLGRAARERRIAELRKELETLRSRDGALKAAFTALQQRDEVISRAYRTLNEMRPLRSARSDMEELASQIAQFDRDIAAVDLRGVQDLESRIGALTVAMADTDRLLQTEMEQVGRVENALETARANVVEQEQDAQRLGSLFRDFLLGQEYLQEECVAYYNERTQGGDPKTILDNYEGAAKGIRTRLERSAENYRKVVQEYNNQFNSLLPFDPEQESEAAAIKKRFEDSELPAYRVKITQAREEAERQFKEHFVARLNEYIEEARESFREINETLRTLSFGRDQYRFTLEERSDRRGQLEVIRKAADINELEGGLFASLVNTEERRTVEALFEKILRNDLDSNEVRNLCDYRTYFTYDIKMRDITTVDPKTGRPSELSLSRVIREKSGGEAQTPYYVAIAAGFYRFYKDDPGKTIRLVLFDEAFNRMDDERIAVALDFFRRLNMQIVTAVPTEKLETLSPHMDTVVLVVRHGYHAVVRDFVAKKEKPTEAGSPTEDRAEGSMGSSGPIEPLLPQENQ